MLTTLSFYARKTHFWISKSFFHSGKVLLRYASPLQISGSPKNVKPKMSVFAFINIYADVTVDIKSKGTTRPTSLRRGESLGKGGVADRALESFSSIPKNRATGAYFAKRSHISATSSTIRITILMLDHIASWTCFLVLS